MDFDDILLPSDAECEKILRQERRERQTSHILITTTRAGKLLAKGKPFVVVACDEPYYLEVYELIRSHERAKDTWSTKDEQRYQTARNSNADHS